MDNNTIAFVAAMFLIPIWLLVIARRDARRRREDRTEMLAAARADQMRRREVEHWTGPQDGFTLIELMIVVAIIGILAAIAIPAYQDYVIRSQVTEGLNLAGGVKAGIVEVYANDGRWPADLNAIGADNANPPSGKYVEKVTIADGLILITYGVQANSNITDPTKNVLALAPGVNANHDVVWQCGYKPQPALGPGSAWSGDAATVTTVTAKFLPSSCRP